MSLLSLFKNSAPNNAQTVLLGTDDFLNTYVAASYLKQSSFRNWERVNIDCETDGIDELIASLSEASLFAERKLILVKNPFFLTSKSIAKLTRQVQELNNIFAHVQETENVVVIIASYDKIDRRKKISKTVLNNFNVVQTNIRPYQIMNVAQKIIKSEGYQISPAALRLLVGRSDQVMDTILSNYAKLKVVCQQHQISADLVKENVDLSLAQNIFEILETAFAGHYQEASQRLTDELKQGANPIQLLAVFENQLELLLVVKILSQRGRSEPEIAKELVVHPYRVKLALRSKMTVPHLSELLKKAISLDYHYKNGSYQQTKFLQIFVLSV